MKKIEKEEVNKCTIMYAKLASLFVGGNVLR